MKIVIYANSFHPNTGGGEKYNLDLANSLLEQGDEITVITPIQSETQDEFRFPVVRIRGNKILSIWKLVKTLKHTSPDILHISGPTEIDFVLPILAMVLGISVIMTYHADFSSKLGRLYNSTMGLFQSPIDKIIVQTDSDKRKLLKRGISPKRIVNFPFSGVDATVYKRFNDVHERDIDLIFVGRMDRAHIYKGHWNFLRILAKLAQNCPSNLSVCIVGGGDDFDQFKEDCSKIEIKTQFMKNIRDAELIKLLNRSKYLILPSTSDSEGFGRSVLEAIYCGAIPIVSKYAGSHELVTDLSCGHVIDPLDIEGTSLRLCNLIRKYHIVSPELLSVDKIIRDRKFTLSWSIFKTRNLYIENLRERLK